MVCECLLRVWWSLLFGPIDVLALQGGLGAGKEEIGDL